MTSERLLKLLERFDRKLTALASQAKEERALQTFEMAESLRQEIAQIKKQTLASAITLPIPPPSSPHEEK